jgi:predicted MPP superfamily phosphohydrolase
MNRRRFLFGMGSAGAVAFSSTLGIGDAERLQATHRKVVLKSDGSPVRVLHLSDLHYSMGVTLTFLETAFRQGVLLEPDVICLTGDYVNHRIIDGAAYSEVLRVLSDAAPTFAVFGNHDGGSWGAKRGGLKSVDPLREVLTNAGVSVLHNASTTLQIRGRSLSIVGVGDIQSEHLDPETAFQGIDVEDETIVLSHNPDTKDELRTYPWKLMLSGHTHGGQVKLPIVGAVFAPIGDMRYVEGLNPWGNRFIHTTCGVGNLLGIRVNCPAELSLLELFV